VLRHGDEAIEDLFLPSLNDRMRGLVCTSGDMEGLGCSLEAIRSEDKIWRGWVSANRA